MGDRLGVLSLLGAVLLARHALQQAREAFETDARIAHRLPSQQMVPHDAVLATLTLLDANDDSAHPEQPSSCPMCACPASVGSPCWTC